MSLLATMCAVAIVKTHAPAPISHEKFKSGSAYYHAVTMDLNSGRFAPSLAHAGRLTSVWNLLATRQPVVAVTGTFFELKAGIPVADMLMDGSLVARGSRGSGIGIGYTGEVSIFDAPFRQKFDWNGYQWGLRGAVRVVSNGKVCPNPKAQKFRDRHIWGKARRTAIGVTKQNKLVIVATQHSVTLSQLGRAMVRRGVVSGVSLDGGSSTCLYYNGSMIIRPQRKLSNMFIVGLRNNFVASEIQTVASTK